MLCGTELSDSFPGGEWLTGPNVEARVRNVLYMVGQMTLPRYFAKREVLSAVLEHGEWREGVAGA